jgi:UrcA family protein
MIANLFTHTRRAAFGLAALSASVALMAGPAVAQPDEGANVTGVTVFAPEATDPTTGARVRPDSVSVAVSLSDLDLTTTDGAREAKRRIEHAAKDVCDRVSTEYPNDVQMQNGCYGPAVRHALRQAELEAGYPIVAWGYY